jgi:hypothetical protein
MGNASVERQIIDTKWGRISPVFAIYPELIQGCQSSKFEPALPPEVEGFLFGQGIKRNSMIFAEELYR